MVYSDAYVEHLSAGPFPGQVDPWAETGRYFHQIHGGMISSLANYLQPRLLPIGYRLNREISLQITEGREPDISIQYAMKSSPPKTHLNYELAATEVLAEPGVTLEPGWDLHAIQIRELKSGDLVTVIELISPSNKIKPESLAAYKLRRERLVVDEGVNIVEVDLTRSVKRLISDLIASDYAYHTAVHIPGQSTHFIGMAYGQSLKRVALPLRDQVVAVELQSAYDEAYRVVTIAGQLDELGDYTEDKLPFPSLLTSVQRQEALEAVKVWQAKLAELREEQG